MSEPQATEGEAQTQCKPRRVRRWHWVLGSIVVLLVLAVVAGFTRLQASPVDAPAWLTNQINAEVEGLLPGGNLSFRSFRVGMDADYHPQLYLDDVTLERSDGVPLAQLRSVQGDLSINALLGGEISLRRLGLSGAVLRVDRARDGSFDFAVGQGGAGVEGLTSFVQVLALLDSVLARDELADLAEVSAEGITVNYTDGVSGQSWTGDGGQLRLFREGKSLLLTAEAAILTGREDLAALALSLERDGASGEAIVTAVIEDAVAADIAGQAPALAWLSVIDAPVSAALRADVTPEGLSNLGATLELGEGALQPNASTRPIPFSDAIVTLDYDAVNQRISFGEFVLDTAWGRASARGTAQLQDFDGFLPKEIVGQFSVEDISANPWSLYETPRSVDALSLDFRLRLDPFTLDVGQIVVVDGDTQAVGSGQVFARQDGWDVAFDVAAEHITAKQTMEFWPPRFRPGLRTWLDTNVIIADLHDANVSLRLLPGQRPQISLSHHFTDADVRILKTLPPVTGGSGSLIMYNRQLSILIEEGQVRAPEGGIIDASGSVFHIADTRPKPATATVTIEAAGTITSMLSLLDQEPFRFLTRANRPVTLADGQARVSGTLVLPLKKGIRGSDVTVDMTGQLSSVRSDTIVAGKTLALPTAQVRATNDLLSVSGAGQIGRVAVNGVWALPLGKGPVGSELRGEIELSPATLDEFSIDLPPGSVAGEAKAEMTLALPREAPPELSLRSAMKGLSVRIPQVGWQKAANTEGTFALDATLGENPLVTGIELSAPGLTAEGTIDLNPGGRGLAQARFSEFRVGDWLAGQLVLTGRGDGVPPAIALSGAAVDLRNAQFGDNGGVGQGAPLSLDLDRLTVTRDIVLTNAAAELSTAGGLSGPFTARVNGGTAVQGDLQRTANGPRVIIRSDDGGGVVRDAGIFKQVNGGDLSLILEPRPEDGHFDGRLEMAGIRVSDAPAMAALLSAISVVGLFEQLDGRGLVFSDVEADFRITPERVIVTQSSAVGASLGISLDGVFNTAAREMDFQGVVSPFYLFNGIGAILTRRGEGLLGFNFTLKGQADNPEVQVNPLSILTPGMFREIFRRPPPAVGQ